MDRAIEVPIRLSQDEETAELQHDNDQFKRNGYISIKLQNPSSSSRFFSKMPGLIGTIVCKCEVRSQ
uniref:Uncharacterized protein n=1 Tax=Nelumbo nucifera TaxID=4432 RepID=A0A822XCA4_NELNU|nr:TPA_asm: hypothetical protein HUJ06_019270 [Nelumbo nucifera]